MARSPGNFSSASSKPSSSERMMLGSNGMGNILTGKRGQLAGLFSFFGQDSPQRGQSVKNAGLHRPQGAFQDFGDLFVTQPFAEPQHQRLPLPLRQQGDAGPQAVLPFG